MGFRRAAEMTYEQLIGKYDIRDLDTVVYPYAACWRHHLGFRYAEFARGGRTLGSMNRINLVAFQEAMTAVANFLDGVATMLSEYVSTQQEIDSYYAEEFGW